MWGRREEKRGAEEGIGSRGKDVGQGEKEKGERKKGNVRREDRRREVGGRGLGQKNWGGGGVNEKKDGEGRGVVG